MHSIESLLATLAVKRSFGSKENDQLLSFCESYSASLGYEVQSQDVSSHSWGGSLSFITLCEESCTVLPSPFSPACTLKAPLLFASKPSMLSSLDARSSILVLHGTIASQPIDNPTLLSQLVSTKAKAIVCLTGTHASTGLSPFPLIREAGFPIPSCYAPASLLESLLQAKEDRLIVPLQIFSEVKECEGRQLLCFLPEKRPTLLVTAPLDSTHAGAGALFHASSIAVMLHLMSQKLNPGVAFLFSNGQAYGRKKGTAAFLCANIQPCEEVISLTGLGCRQSQLAFQGQESSLASYLQAQGLPSVSTLLQHFDCGLPEVVLTSSNQNMLSCVRDTQLDTRSCIDLEILAKQTQAIGDILVHYRRPV